MKKISIIISVYNEENYLKRCLDSVISQSYKNLEIIIVDDGSTDNSLNICLEYQKNDKRIKVIHQENKGLCASRNNGLSNATGDYIWFIDGDDFIEENSLEVIKPYLNNYDIIVFNYNEVRDNKLIKMNDTKEYDNVNKKYILGYIGVWNKIFKREILEGEKFPEGYMHDDIYLIPTFGLKTNKIVFVNEYLYNHVNRSSSITNSGFYLKDKLYALEHLENVLGLEYRDEVEYLYIIHLLLSSIFDKVIRHYKYNFKEINNIMKEKFPKYYKNKYWVGRGLFRKTFLYCFYKNIFIICIMMANIKIQLNKFRYQKME